MASSEASSSAVNEFKRYKKVKCQPKYCKCGVQAVAMVSTTLQNPNAMSWSCKWKHCGVKHCDFWEWLTTESLIYPNTNEEMSLLSVRKCIFIKEKTVILHFKSY